MLPMNGKRLFIVANRLPVTVDAEKGTKPSSGGLVSAMNSFLDHACAEGKEDFSEIFWTGIPGCSATDWTSSFKQESCYTYTFLPVFASKTMYSHYYNGFANSVL